MADVLVEGSAYGLYPDIASGPQLAFTSSTTGYFFYVDSSFNVVYRKTTDSGASWGNAVTVQSGNGYGVTIWADWWTPQDTGTKIHITYVNTSGGDWLYRTLDTSTDTLGTERTITSTGTWVLNVYISIAKSVNGQLVAVGRDGTPGSATNCFRSTDEFATSNSCASPVETFTTDFFQIFPGNDTDTKDMRLLYWDVSANSVTVKFFDDSANSWSESTGITATEPSISNTAPVFSGAVRHSDGNLIFAFFNDYDAAGADLKVYKQTGTGNPSALTDISTNKDDMTCPAVFIDQNTDDIYVGYLGKGDGSETYTATVMVYYRKSTDDGSTWEAEVAYSEDAADDFRSLWVDQGGKNSRVGFVWFDDDDNDFFYGYTNSVSITPYDPVQFPWPSRTERQTPRIPSNNAHWDFTKSYQSPVPLGLTFTAVNFRYPQPPQPIFQQRRAIQPANARPFVQLELLSSAATLTTTGVITRKPTKSPAGALSAAGALTSRAQKVLAGTLTTAGALIRKTVKFLAGALTTAGALSRKIVITFAGAVTAAGAITRKAVSAFAGTLTSAGDLTRKTINALAGTLTTAGTFTSKAATAFAGTLTAVGDLATAATRSLAGTLSTAGALTSRASSSLAGTLTSAGATATSVAASFAGTLSSAGALAIAATRDLAGTLTTAGTTSRAAVISVAGSLSSAGALVRTASAVLTGTLTTAGAIARQATQALAGDLATAGSLTASSFLQLVVAGALATAGGVTVMAKTAYAGTLTTAGVLSRVAALVLDGTLTAAGALARGVSALYAATLTTAGSLAWHVSLAFSAALTTAGSVAKRLPLGAAGALSTAGGYANTAALALAGTLSTAGVLIQSFAIQLVGTLATAGRLAWRVSAHVAGALVLAGLGNVLLLVRGRVLARIEGLDRLILRAVGQDRAVIRAIEGLDRLILRAVGRDRSAIEVSGTDRATVNIEEEDP